MKTFRYCFRMFSFILLLMLISQPHWVVGDEEYKPFDAYEDMHRDYNDFHCDYASGKNEKTNCGKEYDTNEEKQNHSEDIGYVWKRAISQLKKVASDFGKCLKPIPWCIVQEINKHQGYLSEDELSQLAEEFAEEFQQWIFESGIEITDLIWFLTAIGICILWNMEKRKDRDFEKHQIDTRLEEIKTQLKTNHEYGEYKMVALDKLEKQTITTYQDSFQRLRDLELRILGIEENRCSKPLKVLFVRENRNWNSKDFSCQTEKLPSLVTESYCQTDKVICEKDGYSQTEKLTSKTDLKITASMACQTEICQMKSGNDIGVQFECNDLLHEQAKPSIYEDTPSKVNSLASSKSNFLLTNTQSSKNLLDDITELQKLAQSEIKLLKDLLPKSACAKELLGTALQTDEIEVEHSLHQAKSYGSDDIKSKVELMESPPNKVELIDSPSNKVELMESPPNKGVNPQQAIEFTDHILQTILVEEFDRILKTKKAVKEAFSLDDEVKSPGNLINQENAPVHMNTTQRTAAVLFF